MLLLLKQIRDDGFLMLGKLSFPRWFGEGTEFGREMHTESRVGLLLTFWQGYCVRGKFLWLLAVPAESLKQVHRRAHSLCSPEAGYELA